MTFVQFARFVSYLLHPIFVPTLLFAVLFFLTPCFALWNEQAKLYLLGFVFLGTFAFPTAMIAVMFRYKQMQQFEMHATAERKRAFLITSVFYAMIAMVLRYGIFEGTLMEIIMLAIALTVCVASIVNLYTKISMHTVGICGSIGVLFALQVHDSRYELLFHVLAFIFLGGLVASARLATAAHTPIEIFRGFILGFGVAYLAIMMAL
jgi:hypothetical protein